MAVPPRQYIDKSALNIEKPLGSGGFGSVYRVTAVGGEFSGTAAYKEYKSGVTIDPAVLEKFAEAYVRYSPAQRQWLLSKAAWPFLMVTDRGRVCGFVMPIIGDEFFSNLATSAGVRHVQSTIELLCQPVATLAKRGIRISRREQYMLLKDCAEVLRLFHGAGIAVGDISVRNILYSLAGTPRVYVVDCDSMIIGGKTISQPVETPGWEVPKLESPTTAQSDIYKFSLLILRLLAGDQQTRSIADLPRDCPAELRTLISQGLATVPASRPSARTMQEALERAVSSASATPLKPAAKALRRPSAARKVGAAAPVATPSVGMVPPAPPSYSGAASAFPAGSTPPMAPYPAAPAMTPYAPGPAPAMGPYGAGMVPPAPPAPAGMSGKKAGAIGCGVIALVAVVILLAFLIVAVVSGDERGEGAGTTTTTGGYAPSSSSPQPTLTTPPEEDDVDSLQPHYGGIISKGGYLLTTIKDTGSLAKTVLFFGEKDMHPEVVYVSQKISEALTAACWGIYSSGFPKGVCVFFMLPGEYGPSYDAQSGKTYYPRLVLFKDSCRTEADGSIPAHVPYSCVYAPNGKTIADLIQASNGGQSRDNTTPPTTSSAPESIRQPQHQA